MTVQAPPPTKHMIVGSMADIIRTVDEHARELNRRWGMNRLPHLVPIEWTERFIGQKRKWQSACFECTGSPDPAHLDRVRKHGEAMLRAFDKLEELALASGKSPAPPAVWEFELRDGTSITLVRDRAELAQVERSAGTQVWSLEEIADILEQYPILSAAKNEFPQAEVVRLSTDRPVIDALDDTLGDIPW